MKPILKFFLDPIAVGFVIAGIILMMAAFHFNMNPVCAGAVRGEIINYPICRTVLELLIMPAMLIGFILGSPMVIGRDLSSYLSDSGLILVFIYTLQILIYFFVGKIISLCVSLIYKKIKIIRRDYREL